MTRIGFAASIAALVLAAMLLVPIAIGGNRPGQEIEHPMAVVILGGLATSTRGAGQGGGDRGERKGGAQRFGGSER